MSDLLEHLPALPPSSFFEVALDAYFQDGFPTLKKPFLLPDLTEMHGEEAFAEVSLSWSLKGLYLKIFAKGEFSKGAYPKVEDGDTVELFIDTRDLKDIGVVHKFCHHFVFFPEDIAGMLAAEITKFRGDDTHSIAPSDVLINKIEPGSKGCTLNIFIPKEALYGFDPTSLPRIGFTYKINRKSGYSQHFGVSSDFFDIAKHPSLWPTINLKEKS